jgi:S-adenosylmethionine:tRNA ribosyltransferase-isomerase
MDGFLDLKDFYFDLPKELIAQTPLADRAASRLLVLERKTGAISHKNFSDVIDYFNSGDCLAINDTKVLPARLFGAARSGGKIEILLLKRIEGAVWEALVRPGKKAKPGREIVFGERLSGKILANAEDGARLIEFFYEGIFEEVLNELGETPLPPYKKEKLADRSRYQTVYAEKEGSAAAPTAGLHFTPELLEKAKAKGVKIARVTLHIGLGTFRPVKTQNALEHKMHSESYAITKTAADLINETKSNGGKIICAGTTSVRATESAARENEIAEANGDTDIFIYPGYKFKIADAFITNFNLPESTLIMLVAAFAGRENVLRAYREAIRLKYRFFSFGDAVLII